MAEHSTPVTGPEVTIVVLCMGDFDDDDFDVVVIGSGFGGSVTAYELATRGVRVCLLERGKAFPPGSFARTPSEMAHNLWDPSEGLHGMFNVWSFRGIDALTASGLGGGSLIYANVMLRKDPSWFVQHHPYRKNVTERWPITYDDLEPHYTAVEKFLDVQTFPDGADIPKAAALRDAARQIGMGDAFHKAPLAVRFVGPGGTFNPGEPLESNEYPNIFGDRGQARRTCRLCGECDVGCNDGAKNTLDHTYVSAAAHLGAVISIRSEVTALRRGSGGFEVEFIVHDPEREGHKTDTRRLAAACASDASCRRSPRVRSVPPISSFATGHHSASRHPLSAHGSAGTAICSASSSSPSAMASPFRSKDRRAPSSRRTSAGRTTSTRTRRRISGCTSRTPASRRSCSGWSRRRS